LPAYIKPRKDDNMTTFRKHTVESAPAESRAAMTRLRESAGLIPNLAATMSESSVLIDGFVTLREIFQRSTLNAQEREILALSNAIANGCAWCVAFHSFVALKLGIDQAAVEAIRNGETPKDKRSGALNRFARRLIDRRGAIAREDLEDFMSAGFSQQQALDVVAGQAMSLMANYAGNFVGPELDGFLTDLRWSAPGDVRT
jgi:uncharacterized peroxidase-related enzyme